MKKTSLFLIMLMLVLSFNIFSYANDIGENDIGVLSINCCSNMQVKTYTTYSSWKTVGHHLTHLADDCYIQERWRNQEDRCSNCGTVHNTYFGDIETRHTQRNCVYGY